MSIRIRTALFFLLMASLVLAAVYGASAVFLQRSFNQFETSSERQSVQRLVNDAQNDGDQLSVQLIGWASRPDTYAFAQDHNKTYSNAYLQAASLRQLKLNFMLVYNARHELVASKGVETDSGHDTVVPPQLLQPLAGIGKSQQGLVLTPDGLLTVAVRPVVTADAKAPARGELVFARYLRGPAATFYALDDAKLPADVAAVKSQVMAQTVVTRSLSSSRIAGYGLVKDLNGQPRFVARIEGPRPIQIQGQAALRYYLLALAVAIAIACLLTLLVLDRLLVRRITGLSGQLGRITDMAGTLGQVKMAGRDEIGHLASSINAMLRRIYESRGLEQRNTALEEQVAVRTAELNEQLNETRRINQLMVDRELKMVELKEQLAQYEGKPRPKGSKNSAAAESE